MGEGEGGFFIKVCCGCDVDEVWDDIGVEVDEVEFFGVDDIEDSLG